MQSAIIDLYLRSIEMLIYIQAASQAPGNLTLSDGANWNTSRALLDGINVLTDSTDWDLWLCGDADFDTSKLTSRKLVSNASGNVDMTINRGYVSDSTNLYLIYTDNSGSNAADFYITGTLRRA